MHSAYYFISILIYFDRWRIVDYICDNTSIKMSCKHSFEDTIAAYYGWLGERLLVTHKLISSLLILSNTLRICKAFHLYGTFGDVEDRKLMYIVWSINHIVMAFHLNVSFGVCEEGKV